MAINRFESLNRHELPLQAVREREGASKVIVPLHLQVFGVSPAVRQDRGILRGVTAEVSKAYDEDMEHQIEVIKADAGTDAVSSVKGYESFNPDWTLTSGLGKNGFLDLVFRHNLRTSMLAQNKPFLFMNLRGADGEFYLPKDLTPDAAEVVEKSERNGEFLLFSEDKMAQYGLPHNGEYIDQQSGMLRAIGSALESDFNAGPKGVAVNLLLRAYGVFYANRLLEARTRAFN